MDEVAEAIEKYKGLVPLVYDIETMGLDEARTEDMYYAVYLKREADKVITRQKYKRCLAMAEMCHWKMGVFIYKKEKSDFYYRWHKRWLALADKYKEGNV